MNELSTVRAFGRRAFGMDPEGYHAARPAYPDWVFELLCEKCGLAQKAATFEVGAGTGIATRRLLNCGSNPLIAVEPDQRLADFLRRSLGNEALTVIASPFEDVELREASFDLGVSATALHWLDEDFALAKAARLLRSGGWWATVWNVFGDLDRPDPFHEATKMLLGPPLSPSAGSGSRPFALDVDARLAALHRTDAFEAIEHRSSDWSLVLDPHQTVALYATFSNVNARDDREAVLVELGQIAKEEFGGKVTRNMTTSMYLARRSSTAPHTAGWDLSEILRRP